MISEEEQEELEEIINLTHDQSSKITAWEVNFIVDIETRYVKYDKNLILSEKQWNVLRKIYEKCEKD